MSDSPIDIGDWAFKALTGVLGMFGWNLMSRTRKLEIEQQTRDDAAKQRAELRYEMGETKAEVKDLRSEMTRQHTRIFERLDTIVDRLSAR